MDAHRKEPVDRDLRRRQLAQRLVAHQARTRTIFYLTGLSRHQMATLRRRWCVTEDMRLRGPPPRSFALFWSTLRLRSEASALAVFWRILGNISVGTGESLQKPAAVEVGERICEVFEIYLACFPRSELEIEHLVLIARGLEQGDTIAISGCTHCEAAILVDLLGRRRHLCSRCQRTADADLPGVLGPDHGRHDQADQRGEGVQGELF